MPFKGIGWHFVGKDKNPAKKHLRAEHEHQEFQSRMDIIRAEEKERYEIFQARSEYQNQKKVLSNLDMHDYHVSDLVSIRSRAHTTV
ncbi:unnamed protein product [Oikopleura dioica]|uniref:CBF1-interacting co-repressor CIR N-terminal domain-containing protein n=1 Tax=Oikopleura dioica TaxID=34765 RepID=E4Z6Q2_OIKDI|nr:unnamed protein product [Oikopleura dioica]